MSSGRYWIIVQKNGGWLNVGWLGCIELNLIRWMLNDGMDRETSVSMDQNDSLC